MGSTIFPSTDLSTNDISRQRYTNTMMQGNFVPYETDPKQSYQGIPRPISLGTCWRENVSVNQQTLSE